MNRMNTLMLAITLGFASSLMAQPATQPATKPATQPAETEKPAAQPAVQTLEDKWDQLLQDYTQEGTINGVDLVVVDYAALEEDPDWIELLKELETEPVPEGKDARMAYWINTYNILAIKVVLSEYPVDGIKDVTPWYKSVWKVDAGYAAGEMRTLNEVEHEILRHMGDARIHGAIVCASVSCPDLRREAFRAENLDQQLDSQMRVFLANRDKGARVSGNGDTLALSSIFDWFAEDFEEHSGSVKAFVKEYLPKDQAGKITENTDIEYMDYDWSLNDTVKAGL